MRALLLCLVCLACGTGCTTTYEIVKVPQPEVERAGRDLLERPSATVRAEDGRRITVDREADVIRGYSSAKLRGFTSTGPGDYEVGVRRRVVDKDTVLAVGAVALGLGLTAAFVAAQVTCFSSWCDDVGKGLFIASDVTLGVLGTLAVGGFFVAVMRGLSN